MEKTSRSFIKGAIIPFVAMITLQLEEVGITTLGKAAMNKGMSRFVFIVYYNALGTLILLPIYLYKTFRGNMVSLTFSLLSKFFFLGLIGICSLNIFLYTGINYSSPTLAAAILNLMPFFTFVLAIIMRMEKFDIRKWTSHIKIIGTIIAIVGAMVVTLYKGPTLITQVPSMTSNNKLLAQSTNWTLGGLLLVISGLLGSACYVLQANAAKECEDGTVLVFFCSLFGTIFCGVASIFFLEKNHNSWMLHDKIEIITIIFAAISTTIFRNSVITRCLREKGPVYVATYKPVSIVIAVIMGLAFLKENLYLGSVIGSLAIITGFYAFLWGQAKEMHFATENANKSEIIRDQQVSLLRNTNGTELA